MERKRKDCEENTGKFECDCKEVLTYGFFLRFAKKTYIPCKKCQGRLHDLLITSKWTIENNRLIRLIYNPSLVKTFISFELLFLIEKDVHPIAASSFAIWKPCDNCQKYLLNIMRKSELILGHKEYTDPPIELWRKWISK